MSAPAGDGRALAVKLLQSMYRLNDTHLQDVRNSRELMAAALEQFRDLPKKERFRFATILNDMIATAQAGMVFNPAIYDHGRPEITYMRMGTQGLRSIERYLDAGATADARGTT